jgi:hypothetical protein
MAAMERPARTRRSPGCSKSLGGFTLPIFIYNKISSDNVAAGSRLRISRNVPLKCPSENPLKLIDAENLGAVNICATYILRHALGRLP